MKTRTTCSRILIALFLVFSNFSHAQKAIKDMSIVELNQKKTAAVAAKSMEEIAMYETALKLKTDIEAALKIEDYEKAAALQQQLVNLKPKPAVVDKAKELQEAIDKAVTAEDYTKANALKKELEVLTNPPTATLSSKPVSAGSATTVMASAPVAGNSNLTKNDIYGSAATWMGLDFSLFNFVSSKKTGEEQKQFKYIAAWQEGFAKKIPEKKLAQWLGKGTFHSDHGADNLYTQNLNRQWIVATNRSLSNEQIQAHLQTYKSNNHGLGLVMLPGSFDETEGEMSLYVVWFDLDSRSIVNLQQVSVKASPSSMTARWLNGLFVATKKYIDQYYKKRI